MGDRTSFLSLKLSQKYEEIFKIPLIFDQAF